MAQMPFGACSSSQPGNNFCDSFVVNSKHNLMLLVSLGRNINMYALTMPRKVHTSVAVFGTGHFKIMSTLPELALTPHCKMWQPRKSISSLMNSHFLDHSITWWLVRLTTQSISVLHVLVHLLTK